MVDACGSRGIRSACLSQVDEGVGVFKECGTY